MGGLILLGVFIGALVVFDIIALARSTDTRPGFSVDSTTSTIRPL